MTTRRVDVVVAAILDGSGQVLVARRPDHVHQGGKLELPGGKIEAGETPLEALGRELEEELGIRPLSSEPLISLTHDYPDKSVRLHVYSVKEVSGEPRGREGQSIAWRGVDELAAEDFPAANVAILNALKLPRQLLVTPDLPWTGRGIQQPLEQLSELVERNNPAMVLLRQPRFPQAIYQRLACLLRERFGRVRWLHYSDKVPDDVMDTIWHLRAEQLTHWRRRDEIPARGLSASVHNLSELRRAEALGVDFVVLGSVRETPSHPEEVPLGWEEACQLVAVARVPVYLIGGMTMEDVGPARAVGAQGIAGIRCFGR